MYQQVLKILNNKQIYNAEQLATRLAINPNQLKQIINDLVAYGIKLNCPAANTYQLIETVELLDAEKIRAELTNNLLQLEIFEVIDSTNQYALAQTNIIEPLVCIAEYQTAGRGRQDHRWISSYASGLCLSIKCNYTNLKKLDGLSIALAVTIARILYNLGITEIGLKWPNDVMWKQRKLAGLLLESRYGKKCEVVMGVGINVTMPPIEGISQPWIDLASILTQPPTRNTLAAYLIDNCLATLLDYPATGLAPFLDDWQRFDLSYGKLITLHTNNEPVQGIAMGINDQGALQVNNKNYICGEVNLKII